MPESSKPEQARQEGLSPEELAAEQSMDLPEREAMSAIHLGFGGPLDIGNLSMPINQAIAENVDSPYSSASAGAEQVVISDQTIPSSGT